MRAFIILKMVEKNTNKLNVFKITDHFFIDIKI